MSKKRNQNIVLKLNTVSGFDFSLFVISYYKGSSKLCCQINNILNIELKRDDDIKIRDDEGIVLKSHSIFNFHDFNSLIDYSLISNKSENGVLVKEFPTVDYFFRLSGNTSESTITDIISKLKSNKDILMIQKITENPSNKKTTNALRIFSAL